MPRPRSDSSPKPSGTAPPAPEPDLADLFAGFEGHDAVALAVSGGPDSMALMHLAAEWTRGRRTRLIVLTVDHGLRAEAASETAFVAGEAARIGLSCRILRRDAPKTSTGLQARARRDRYRLLAAAAREAEATALATGHTADDQGETLLMRLARGSGIEGLAAMAPATDLAMAEDGKKSLMLLRPLLGLTKAHLIAWLDTRGLPYITDPSNANPAFERARLRLARPSLEAIGLTTEHLALSARRLARAHAALEAMAAEANGRLGRIEPDGWVSFPRPQFDGLPAEIRLRLLGRWIARIGTPSDYGRLGALETIASALSREVRTAAVLGGCRIRADARRVAILREPGRAGLPVLTLVPGAPALWDRRFLVSAPAGGEVRALRPKDLSGEIASILGVRPKWRLGLDTAPIVERDGALVAAPTLGITHEGLDCRLVLSPDGAPEAGAPRA